MSRDTLFTGQGTAIQKYSLSGEKLLTQQLFARNKIHGIDVNKNHSQMLVFGGDSILVTDLECSSRDERSVGDWICDAKFGAQDGLIYVLTAHNKVLILDHDLKVKEIVTCSENSLLYSGSLHVTSDTVLIASGTVLHGIYIWTLDGTILHNFTDHEGSIFNVQISRDQRHVISCSDDRFVKLFDLAKGKCVASGFGHGARIWQVGFYNDAYISSSEDSTAILWHFDESREVLEPVKTFPGHVGKNMWCFDVLDSTLVTGGGDGRWREFDLELDHVTEYKYEDVIGQSGAFKNFVNLSFTKTAIGTANGEVYLIERVDSKVNWTLVYQNDNLKSLNLMAGWKDTPFCAVGSRFGQVYVINTETKEVTELQVFEGKVSGMLTRDGYLMVTSQNDRDDNVLVDIKTMEVKRYPAVDTFPVTCFDVCEGHVIMGSRFGALCYFSKDSDAPTIIRKAINAESVTDILFTDASHVMLTTKNGFYGKLNLLTKQFSLLNKSGQNSIYQILSVSPLITCGFKTNSFFVYDESANALLFSADCGGAHRSWDVYFEKNHVLFNFVRKSVLCEVSSHVINTSAYYSHGREVRAIEANGDVIASGAEDTNIILSEVQEGKLTNLYTYRKHTSGIQTLKWVTKDLLVSSSAREELFIWKYDSSKKTLVPWLSLPRGDNPDLRIMDFCYIETDTGFNLICVYSDSSLRLWSYNGQFEMVEELKYTQHCLLNVDLVEEGQSVLISATDGSLSVYELPSLRPKSHIYAHQSSVRFCQKGGLIFSGGDDNKLVVSKLENGELKVLASKIDAHSSTITEVAVVDEPEVDVVSVSVDQNVRKWKFVNNDLVLVSDEFTTVADTGCVCPYKGGLLIGGAGLDYWTA